MLRLRSRRCRITETLVVLPSTDSPVEAVPGIWGTGDESGMLCVIGTDEFDTVIEPGTKVAEVHAASIQTRVCQKCGCQDTDAWIKTSGMKQCRACGTGQLGGKSPCRQCSAGPENCCVLGYSGCLECRPERNLKGRVRRGPAAGLLARSAIAFAALSFVTTDVSSGGVSQPQPYRIRKRSSRGFTPAGGALSIGALDVKYHPVYHIIEEPVESGI